MGMGNELTRTLCRVHGLSWLAFSLFVIHFGCRNLPNNNVSSPELQYPPVPESIYKIDSARADFAKLTYPLKVASFYAARNYEPVWTNLNRTSADGDSLIAFIERVRNYGISPVHVHSLEILHLADSLGTVHANLTQLEIVLTDSFYSLAFLLHCGYPLKQDNCLLDSLITNALEKISAQHNVLATLLGFQITYSPAVLLQNALESELACLDSATYALVMAGRESDTTRAARIIRVIEQNLNRMKRDAEINGRYIVVNIPAFELSVFENNNEIIESRVIVGTTKDPTPELNGVIRAITLFPYWTVPRRIAVEELLPNIRVNRNYLAAHNYELLDANGNVVQTDAVDFSKLNKHNFPYTIRQREGPGNSLGVIKFTFDNPYDVYLHDTNARYLFNTKQRALSHGCVRVEKAFDLARYLLEDDLNAPHNLDKYLAVRKQRVLNIRRPIPVHIRYYTCEVKNGELRFYHDLYKKDKKDWRDRPR